MTQIPPSDEWLLRRQVASGTLVVFFCPVYDVLHSCSVGKKTAGEPRLLPLAGRIKTLAAAQEAGGWPSQPRGASVFFEPAESCKSTHCYLPGTVWLTPRPEQQHYSRSARCSTDGIRRSLPRVFTPLQRTQFHKRVQTSLQNPPPSAHSVIARFVLPGKVSIVRGSFNKRGIAWKGQERASGGEPPSDED